MTFLLTALLSLTLWTGDAMPTQPEAGVFALTNARIETVANGVIENGTVIIRDGRIEAVGTDVPIPSDATIINCDGLTVYPGMIDSGTTLGLVEVSAVPRTVDMSEIGDITSQVSALTAVNPNSTLIPVTRVSGVTTVVTRPNGGLIPGMAALINLHGYTPKQMNVAGMQYMMMSFPSTGRRSRFDNRSEEDIKKASERALKKLNDLWDSAELYAAIDSAHTASPETGREPEYNPQLKALVPVVRGEMKLMVNVNAAKDILGAIEWLQGRGLDGHSILVGAAEGWRVADKIAESGIPVIVGPMLSTPTRASDRFDKPYANPGLMHNAGVKLAIRSNESENVRNLPFNAGFAAAYGLGREQALRAVTLTAAEILGVADEIGSIEAGKMANLFVADGDPFETQTLITHVFIDGYNIPLVSRHTELYDEFLNRDPGVSKHD